MEDTRITFSFWFPGHPKERTTGCLSGRSGNTSIRRTLRKADSGQAFSSLHDEVRDVPLRSHVFQDRVSEPLQIPFPVSGHDVFLPAVLSLDGHTEESLLDAARWIEGAKEYYLQQYKDSGAILDAEGLAAFDADEMRALADAVRTVVPTVQVRGV